MVTHNKLAPSLSARAHKGQTRRGNDGRAYKSTRYPSGQYRWKRVRLSRRRSRSWGRRRRFPQSSRVQEPRVLRVTAFTNEDTGDPKFAYTYKNPTKKTEQKKVIKSIKEAMEGFNDLRVCPVKGGNVNKFDIYSTGPDESTSVTLRNLAQMGEFTPYTVRLTRGREFLWQSFKRVKEIPPC